MKHKSFIWIALLLCIPLLYSCDPTYHVERGAWAVNKTLNFTADGGSNETAVDGPDDNGIKRWHFDKVYSYEKEVSQAVEKQLPDGSFVVEADWAKFYYPRDKSKIRVEVEPNPSKEPRKLILYSRSGPNEPLYLIVSQAGKSD